MNLIPKMVRLPLGRTFLGVVLFHAVTGNVLLGQIKVNNVHPATDKQFNQPGEMEDPREITIRVGTRMENLAGRERDISTVGGKHWNFSTGKGSGGFFTPPKGEITGVGKDGSGWYINYKPYHYVVGEDQFIYDVLLSDGTELNCSTSIEFPLPVQRKPFLLKDNTRYSSSLEYAKGSEINISFEENQRVAFTFTLFDPEPQTDDELEAYLLADSNASVTIENIKYNDGVEQVEANLTFELKSDKGVMNGSSANGLNGFVRNYEIHWKPQTLPDFESLHPHIEWNLTIVVTDEEFGESTYPLVLRLDNLPEAPSPLKFQRIGENESMFKQSISIDERNSGDAPEESPYIGAAFRIRSETESLSSQEQSTYRLKYDIVFDEKGIKSFPDGEGELEDLNMYDTLSSPYGLGYEGVPPEEVYIYLDYNQSIGLDASPIEDDNIIKLSRGEYSQLDGLSRLFESEKEYGVVVKFEDDYFTFPGRPLTLTFTAEDGGMEADVFELEISIQNDLDDKITVASVEEVDQEYLKIEDTDDGYNVIFQENRPENSGLRVLQLVPSDKDSHPHPLLQEDYNESAGIFRPPEYPDSDYRNGAGIFYKLTGPKADLFLIDEEGRLKFKKMPDYENDQTNFDLQIYLHDKLDDFMSSNVGTGSFSRLDLSFVIKNGPDLPRLKNDIYTYENVRTRENESVTLNDTEELVNLSDFLKVLDDDGEASTINWKYGLSEKLGEVDFNETSLLLRYTPPENYYGPDQFTLTFWDSFDKRNGIETEQEIVFDLNISNKNDPPTIGQETVDPVRPLILYQSGLTEAVKYTEDDVAIKISEEENNFISLKIPLKDTRDFDHIKIVKLAAGGSYFNLSQPYQDEEHSVINPNDGENYLWFVDLNWSSPNLPDYETVPGDEKVYSAKIEVEDSRGDVADFSFKIFITNNPNEPPYFEPLDKNDSRSVERENSTSPFKVWENYKDAIITLDPKDPEDRNISQWTWRISGDNANHFVFSNESKVTTSATPQQSVELFFNKEAFPNYEFYNDEDINVSITVSSTFDGADTMGREQIITFQLVDRNDAPFVPQSILEQGVVKLIIFEEPGTAVGPPKDYTNDNQAVWNLNEVFVDEDLKDGLSEELIYLIAPGTYNFTGRMKITGNRLYMTEPPNYEDEGYEGLGYFEVAAYDSGSKPTKQLFEVEIIDMPDPPSVISRKLPGDSEVWKEDDGPFIVPMRQLVEDVDAGSWDQDRGLEFFKTVLRDANGREQQKDDPGDPDLVSFYWHETDRQKVLEFNPPKHASGKFILEYQIDDNDFYPAEVEIEIEEVSDPPVVQIDDQYFDGNPNILGTEGYSLAGEEGDYNATIYLREGQSKTIATFKFSDANDRLNQAEKFEAQIIAQAENAKFKIEQSSNDTTEWKLSWDINESGTFGLPFVDSLDTGPFELEVAVKEKDRISDRNQSDIKVKIFLEVVDDKNPIFEIPEPSNITHGAYIENSSDDGFFINHPEGFTDIGTFTAYDPDPTSNPITFSLDTELDFTEFDLINTGDDQFKLNLNNSPEYDRERFPGKKYQVRVIAEEGLGGARTYKLFDINITNVVEVPYFEDNGTTFSTIEGTADQKDSNVFIVTPATDDVADEGFSVRVSEDYDNYPDNFLFTEDSSLNHGFRFIRPPDFENPEDYDTNNKYEVLLEVTSPDGSQTGQGLFFVEVFDAQMDFGFKPFDKSQAQSDKKIAQRKFEIPENTKFVQGFSVFDEEAPSLEFTDLVGYGSEMFGFWPNSKLYDGNLSVEPSGIFTNSAFVDLSTYVDGDHSFVLSADVNRSGMQDLIVLSETKITYLKNKGGKNFVKMPIAVFEEALKEVEQVRPQTRPNFARFADLNSDGFDDLVVAANYSGGGPRLFYFASSPGKDELFSEAVDVPLEAEQLDLDTFTLDELAVADVNQDHHLDLILPVMKQDKVAWYENTGNGQFKTGKVISFNNYTLNKPRFVRSIRSLDLNASEFNQHLERFGTSKFSKDLMLRDIIVGADSGVYLAQYDFDTGAINVSQEIQKFTGSEAISFLGTINPNQGVPDLIWSRDGKSHYAIGKDDLDAANSPYPQEEIYELKLKGTSVELKSALQYTSPLGNPLLILNENSNTDVYIYEVQIDVPKVDAGYQLKYRHTLSAPKFAENLQFADLDRKQSVIKFSLVEAKDYYLFDEARFEATGMLLFNEEVDDENKKDSDEDGTYEVDIEIQKYASWTDDIPVQESLITISIDVEGVNEPAYLLDFYGTGDDGIYEHPEHFRVVGDVNFTNPETYSFEPEKQEDILFTLTESGRDNDNFEINSSSGRLTFKNAPNLDSPHPYSHEYHVEVMIKEVGTQRTDNRTLKIKLVEGGGEPPVFNPANVNGGVVSSTSGHPSITYTIEEDNDKVFYLQDLNVSDQNLGGAISSFSFSEEVQFGELLFFFRGEYYNSLNESQLSDLDGNFTEIELHYRPNSNFGGRIDTARLTSFNQITHKDHNLSADIYLNFNVEPVNDPPVLTLPQEVRIAENSLDVLSLQSLGYDPDDEDQKFMKWRVADENKSSQVFMIKDEKILRFKAPEMADFERQTQHVVKLILSSGDGERKRESNSSLEVYLENLQDEPPESSWLEEHNQLLGLNIPIPIAEKTIFIENLGINDPDGYQVLEQSLDGNDSKFFFLDEDGNLSVSPDYPEGLFFSNPLDENKNNIYELRLSLIDSNSSRTYPFSLEVVEPPRFIDLANEFTIPENTKVVTELNATGRKGTNLVFRVVGGANEDLFTITNSNRLEFRESPNFEMPKDYYAENIYEVEVEVYDGLLTASQEVQVFVSNVNDPPTLKTKKYTIDEDVALGKRFSFLDDENDTVEFIRPEPDQEEWNPDHGELSIFGLDFLYQPQANYNGTDSFTILLRDRADPSISNEIDIEIEILPVNDPPVAVDDIIYYHDLRKSFPLYINVLGNDHSGADENDTEDFELVSFTNPSHGNLKRIGKDLLSYFPVGEFLDPNVPFIGVDRFTYTMRDEGGLSANAEVSICIAKHESSPAWTFYKKFGFFYEGDNWKRNQFNQWVYIDKNKWIYSEKFDWIYVNKPENLFTASWIWHDHLGWFWTGESHFAWIYSHEFKKWLYLEGAPISSNNWTLRDTDDIIYNATDFERVRVRNDVIRILPDLAKLGDYVASSDFFLRSQKGTIITELNRFKRSNTLNQILEFDFQY